VKLGKLLALAVIALALAPAGSGANVPLPTRITQALAVCKASGADLPPDADLHQLHELLHGVAGSAGTFGFAVFGQQARRIEHMVRGVLTDHTGWPAVITEVEKLLIWASRDAQATTYE